MPFAALKRLAEEGKIKPETLVWHKSLSSWCRATTLDELKDCFPTAPPPLPQRPPPLPTAGLKTAQAPDMAQAPARVARAEATDEITQEDLLEDLDQEDVEISALDTKFFEAGAAAQHARGDDSIELADDDFFPAELEERRADKGARASLADFSVMVRLSRRSRAKQIFVLVTLCIVLAGSLVMIFALGDPLGVIYDQKRPVEDVPWEGHKGLMATIEQDEPDNGAEEQEQNTKAPGNVPGIDMTDDSDSDKLLKAMQEKEWAVTIGDDLEVDSEAMAARLKGPEPKAHRNGSTRKENVRRTVKIPDDPDSGDEISLAEYAAQSNRKKNENLVADASGSKAHLGTVEEMDSAMGNLLGGSNKISEKRFEAKVKEREGDGVALKALLARHVGKKVNGARKHLQRCVGSYGIAGSGGALRVVLHFNEQGNVRKVTVKGGQPALEKCFLEAFAGWRLSMINKKIQIPISVRFQ